MEKLSLHAKVTDLDGVLLAGLGGNFLGRVWRPPVSATFQNRQQAMERGPYQWRDGQRPNPSLYAAIYPEDVECLAGQRADILITHEAPSCHSYGFEALDELGSDARAVACCSIKNGLGEVIHQGPAGW